MKRSDVGLDALLVFPPMTIASVLQPEVGVPQLTANLRRRGFQVRQADLNMEFLHGFLTREEALRQLLESETHVDPDEICPAPAEFQVDDELIETLLERGHSWKRGHYVPESTTGARELLRRIRDRNRLTNNLHDGKARQLLAENLARTSAVSGSYLDRLNAACRDEHSFWITLVEGLQELCFSPRTYLVEDVMDFVENRGAALRTFFERALADQCGDGIPPVVGISIQCVTQVAPALILARAVKGAEPGTSVVAGGPWCTMAQGTLPHCPELFELFDAVVLHEAERPLEAILRRVKAGGDVSNIPGVVWCEDGKVVTEPTGAPQALSTLELPVYDGYALGQYTREQIPLRLVRGCTWGRCSFCHHVFPTYNRRYATGRGDLVDGAYLERALEHVERYGAESGVGRLILCDNEIPAPIMVQISEALLARGLEVEWEALARFEPEFTREVCELMVRSGCRGLMFGLETGLEEELDRLNKGIGMETVRRVLEDLYDLGVRVDLFMMNFHFQGPAAFDASLTRVREQLPFRGEIVIQRYNLARSSSLLRDPSTAGLRILTDPDRDLNVHALEYEAPGGTSLDEFMEITARNIKALRQGRDNRARRRAT